MAGRGANNPSKRHGFLDHIRCRAERVRSLTRVAAVASTEARALFNPELLTSAPVEAQAMLNLDRVERALFQGQTPKPVEPRVEVCTAPDAFGRQFSASAQSDQVRVFDVRRALLASGTALWVALYSRDALVVSLTEGTANWEVALLDDNYRCSARHVSKPNGAVSERWTVSVRC